MILDKPNINSLLSFLGTAQLALSSDTVACSRLCRLRNKQTRLSESSRDQIHFVSFIEFYVKVSNCYHSWKGFFKIYTQRQGKVYTFCRTCLTFHCIDMMQVAEKGFEHSM